MKRSQTLLVSLPPVILGILSTVFWDHLNPSPVAAGSAAETVASVDAAPESPLTAPSATAAPSVAAPSAADTTAGTDSEKTSETEAKQPTEEAPKTPADYAVLFREHGAALSENPLWRQFAEAPEALEILVKAVEQVAGGSRPLALGRLSFLPEPAPFEATENNGVYTISEKTQQRFAPVLDAVLSIPPEKAAEFLKEMEPELNRLVQEKLGYPEDQTFRKMLNEALTVVLTTPVPEEPLELVKITDRIYRYKLQQVEELSEAQKFILRMGLSNQARLNDYARRLWPLF